MSYLSKVPREMMGTGQAKSLGVAIENVTSTEEADGGHAGGEGAYDPCWAILKDKAGFR